MAFITETPRPAAPRTSLRTRLGAWMERVAEGNTHIREIRALQAKSDAELARMGLARGDIPAHVMRARYYI